MTPKQICAFYGRSWKAKSFRRTHYPINKEPKDKKVSEALDVYAFLATNNISKEILEVMVNSHKGTVEYIKSKI
jgi:hypothetical protein